MPLNVIVITAVPTLNVSSAPPLTVATLGSDEVHVPTAAIDCPCDGPCQRIARTVPVPPAAPAPIEDISMYGYGRGTGRTDTGIDAVKPLYEATISAAP